MKRKLTYPILLLLLMAGGCKKAEQANNQETKSSLLASVPLKKMEWPALGHTATLNYNGDGTLAEIVYQRPGISEKRSFGHGWNGIAFVASTQSLAFNSFDYDPTSRKIAKMERIIGDAQTARVYQSQRFGYNNFLQLTSLKFYNENAAGATLRSTTNYQYVSTLVSEITIVDQFGNQRLIKIDQYSDEFDFDPLWFMEMEIGTLAPLYNLPILRHLASRHRLPSSFKIFKLENGQSILEKEYVIDYTIANRRLEKQVTSVKDHIASMSSALEVVFKY